jgi:hypothetical protein
VGPMSMNKSIDVYVCNPDVGINKSLEAVFIQFEVMDRDTQEGTGKSHTVLMTMPDAMRLLRHLENLQQKFSLPNPPIEIAMAKYRNRKRKTEHQSRCASHRHLCRASDLEMAGRPPKEKPPLMTGASHPGVTRVPFESEAMPEITWHKALEEDSIPRDRRLLLIATPRNVPTANLKADLVVGHWNESLSCFVPVEIPYPRDGARPELNVKWWAEVPAVPDGAMIRPLAPEDLKG